MGILGKRSIPPLCIAIVATVVAVQSMRRQGETEPLHQAAETPAPPCSEAQRALLGGLDVGQFIGDFRVIGFRCAQPRVMEIDLRRDVTPLVLIVAEPGAVPHNAPRQTKQHDIFYTRQTPEQQSPTQREIDALLVLLAKRVEDAEK